MRYFKIINRFNFEIESKMTEHIGNGAGSDPKNVQELTNFVQVTLQQMQDKFQSMSDQIINRNILLKLN